ncbi:MAG: glycosyltransferase [Candidatus Zixiibacteriota bacterium]|nr:MAG: glycosyltransferase [candidate division Zixibacteria bacterium]
MRQTQNRIQDEFPVDVTIVITNHNRAHFLDRAIRSCLDQLVFRQRLEVLVVDDGSTDDSLSILQTFENDIQIIALPNNRGVAAASNVGLGAARGRYWMRVDSDDFLNRMAVTFFSALLDENPQYAYCYGDLYRVDDLGHKTSKTRLDCQEALFEHGAGVMFRTEILRALGGYDERLREAEDYDLFRRLTAAGHRGFYLPLPLYRYHIHGGNVTLNGNREYYKALSNGKAHV